MPVYFKKCADVGEIFELGVDAVAVPRPMYGEQLPKITQYIYEKAGADEINGLYAENKGNDYWWTEHFPDIPGGGQCGLVSENDPVITATGGGGLDFKYIFHICMGLHENSGALIPSDSPELYEILEEELRDDDDAIIEEFGGSYTPDDENCYILRRCYELVLACAQQRGVRSIAIPILGMEDNSGFPYSVAYHAARTVPQSWLETHSRYEFLGGENRGVYSGRYRLIDEMDVWIIDPPRDFKWSYNPVPNITGVPNARKKRFLVFESNLKERIESSGMSPEQFARSFIWECLKDVNISRLQTEIDYDPTKFKNGQLRKPALHRVIAIAVGLGLDDFDRYTLIHCAGYKNYPSADFEFCVEETIAAGIRGFDELNMALCDKGYGGSPLTAQVRGSKKGKKKPKKPFN